MTAQRSYRALRAKTTGKSMPPTAATLLDSESHIARLTAHAGLLLQIQQEVDAALPRQLAKAVRVANFRLGKVVIHAANGAVAAKLRQILPGLLGNIGQTRPEVKEIEVKVQPSRPVPRPVKMESRTPIGQKQKHALTSLSEKLPANSPLKLALERLAGKKQ